MEVAKIPSARATETNESNKWPAALSRAGAGAVSATSLLFAWLATGTLRRCGAMDEAEVFPGVVWGLSPLICAYLYSWTVALSPSPRAVVARATCLLLLAAAADKLMPPIAGAATTVVLAPLHSAFACGRALAERRQRAGTECWSATTAASTTVYQSSAEEGEEQDRQASVGAFMAVILAVYVAVGACLVSWLSPETVWEDPPTDVVFYLAGPFILAARLMPRFSIDSDGLLVFGAVIGGIGWIVVAVSASVNFGMIAGTVVVWMGELGMLVFLGYFLAVEAHYKQLMAIERRKPRTAKDASGLLDGRDSDDACSAHIDAAAGICVECLLPRSCKFTCRSQIIS